MNKKFLIPVVIIIVIAIGGIAYYYLSKNQSETPQQTSENQTSGKFEKSVFFIHHSTGEIYWNGGMEEILTSRGFIAAAPFWEGATDPPDFYGEFTNQSNWEILESYSVIIFKSCFPASDITSDEMLEEYKGYYNQLYEVYEDHPDKLFVPMSTPPLLEGSTSLAAAQRSLEFENWLLGEYKDNYSGTNLVPFGLHSLLSDNNGYLASEFISEGGDDHPNDYSGQVVGEAIWEHLKSYVEG